jgi:hypothetical protein
MAPFFLGGVSKSVNGHMLSLAVRTAGAQWRRSGLFQAAGGLGFFAAGMALTRQTWYNSTNTAFLDLGRRESLHSRRPFCWLVRVKVYRLSLFGPAPDFGRRCARTSLLEVRDGLSAHSPLWSTCEGGGDVDAHQVTVAQEAPHLGWTHPPAAGKVSYRVARWVAAHRSSSSRRRSRSRS